MDEAALGRALMRISHEITEKNRGVDNVVLVGIRRRGEPIACRIRDNIKKIEGVEPPCGSIDIGFYRDDLSTLAESPVIRKAELPFDVNDRDVVLCDDVLYTGRTARAAHRSGVQLRPPAHDTVRSAGRQGTPGAAYPRGLCRQEHPHLAQRAYRGAPAGVRRRDGRVPHGDRRQLIQYGNTRLCRWL